MVVKRQCSFCAREIEPGTGMMFVRRDGTVYHFCTSSCRKQQLHLHRVGHHFKWTHAHALKRAADRSSPEKAPTPPAGAKAGRTRPVSAAAPPAAPAAPTAAPSGAEPPARAAEAPAAEAAPPAAAAKKPRRPRKKAESPSPE